MLPISQPYLLANLWWKKAGIHYVGRILLVLQSLDAMK